MKVTYENIVEYLNQTFPEFTTTKEYKEGVDEDFLKLPYYMLALFVNYTLGLFRKNGPDDAIVQRFFAFVNEQFDTSSDKKLLTLLTIEVFEGYAQEKESLAFARMISNEKARFNLESALWLTGVDAPDEKIAPEAAARRKGIKIDLAPNCAACGFDLGMDLLKARVEQKTCPSCGFKYFVGNSIGGSTIKTQALYRLWREAWISNGKKPISDAEANELVLKAKSV